MRPHSLDSTATGQPAKHVVNAVAYLSQDTALLDGGPLGTGAAKRSQQLDSLLLQNLTQARPPVVAASQQPAVCVFGRSGTIFPSDILAGANFIWVMTQGRHSRTCRRKS